MKKLFWWAAFLVTVAFWGSAFEPSPAQAVTPIPSNTATATFTFTATNTFTALVTPTGTLSPHVTPTPTSTATLTASPTITGTFTYTPTGTLSPSLSPTPTSTPTLTFTITPTITKTATKTPTVTMTATSTPGVFQFSVSPKPDASNQIHFKWGTTTDADHTYLRIFTNGLRPVLVYEFSKDQKPENLSSGTHEIVWDGKDEEGRPMPPGSYICFISISANKKTYDANSKTEIP